MREVNRSALVPYAAEHMFDLIADIESYADFLPWCKEARILSGPEPARADPGHAGQEVVARLALSQGPLQGHFTTRNEMQRPRSISMKLVEGSFSALDGLWQIEPLGEDGCRLELRMRFEFANRLNDVVLGPVFAHSCNRLVDAFVDRARAVHGA